MLWGSLSVIKTDYKNGERVIWYKDLSRHKCNKIPAIFLGITASGRARIAVPSDKNEVGAKRIAVDIDNIEKIKEAVL
jgi:hypothetical protein